jgi:hypothetical protein
MTSIESYREMFQTKVFEIQLVTAASMNMAAFWDTPPCGLVYVDRRFRGAYCIYHQGDQSTSTRLHGAIFQKAAILKSFQLKNFSMLCVSVVRTMKQFVEDNEVLFIFM